MSTYNGENYLKEQLDSIFNQKEVEINLFIRDDGSMDNTVDIVKEYMVKYPNKINLIEGNNIGFANSFYYLVKINPKYEYYALSDQDDIWDDDKLISGIKMINKKSPLLYACNLNIFDVIENRSGNMYSNKDVEKAFTDDFFISNPYGCTMIWNESFQQLLMKYDKPEKMTHDTWINVIANCKGRLVFDYNSHINYRIHQSNACGTTPKSIIRRLVKYFKRYFIDNKKIQIQMTAKYIKATFPNNTNNTIDVFVDYDKSIVKHIHSIFYVLMSNIHIKKKLVLLMIFRKL